jgi:type II secretory pathway component PulF
MGLPEERALRVVSETARDPLSKTGFDALAEKVKAGATVPDGMASLPASFAPWIVSIVQKTKDKQELIKALKCVINYTSWHLRPD